MTGADPTRMTLADRSGPTVAVVDYGIGNLHSAHKALEREGARALLTSDPAEIAAADAVVLPGVGAFGACMDALRSRGLEAAVIGAAASGRPFLGICVGTQMLFDSSAEDESARGLGIIPGRVEWIPNDVKRPQMQWNRLTILDEAEPILHGLSPAAPSNDGADDGVWVYFVHSLHGVPNDGDVVVATCEYGGSLNAAFRLDNVFAVQFHPEKSGPIGLRMLSNFVRVAAPVGDAR